MNGLNELNGSQEYVQLVKLQTLLQNTDVSVKEIYMFLKENMNVFTDVDFRKHVLKESLMLLMIFDDSTDGSDVNDLVVDVIFQLLTFTK